MAQRSWVGSLLVALKKDWRIVAVSTVVALVVAAGLTLGAKTTYKGKAVIRVDNATLQLNARLPKAEAVLAEARDEFFAEEVAEALDVDTAEIEDGLNSFTSGASQNRVNVTYTSQDKAEAHRVAKAAAATLMVRTEAVLAPEIDRQVALLAETDFALDALEASEDGADKAYYIWAVKRSLVVDEANLALYETAYTYNDKAVVTATSRTSKVRNAGIAGALLGLVFGIGVVAARDYSRRSREASG